MSFVVTIIRDPGALNGHPEQFAMRVAHRSQVPALVRTMTFAAVGEHESQSIADAAHRTFGNRNTTGWKHTIRHGLTISVTKE